MPASTEPMPPEVWEQVWRFCHLFQHLRARQQGWEYALLADCWEAIWFGPDSLPVWAVELADAGQSGWHWCPVLRPELRARAGAPA